MQSSEKPLPSIEINAPCKEKLGQEPNQWRSESTAGAGTEPVAQWKYGRLRKYFSAQKSPC